MPSAAPSADPSAQAENVSSTKRRAADSSLAGTASAPSQARRSGWDAAIHPQPAAKARSPGAIAVLSQPGTSANAACRYVASARLAGAGQCGHSAHGGQVPREVGCASWAQPAGTRIAATKKAKARTMWVIYLEMGVALALLILIVWWTWPAKPREDRPQREGREGGPR